MKFRIHYDKAGCEDAIVIEGDTVEEVREIAKNETEKRRWNKRFCWSEEIK